MKSNVMTRRLSTLPPLALALLALVLFAGSCNKPVKHYALQGKIVSIDKPGGLINVDAEAIPGFMAAMVMGYKARPASELDQLRVGDAIEADLVVSGEDYWLEHVKVTQHASAGSQRQPSGAQP